MINTEIMIVGAGTAGIQAALTAAASGAEILLCDRKNAVSKEDAAAISKYSNITLWSEASVVGVYEDHVLTVVYKNEHLKVKPQRLIVATGSIDRYLAFGNNDLPGILSAGTAIQLVKEYGVLPGSNIIAVGTNEKALAEIRELLPEADVRNDYTILNAIGEEEVTGAVIAKTDRHGCVIPETEEQVACDAICIATERKPIVDICSLAECDMTYVEELGGYIAETDSNMETTVAGVYCAGECAGVEPVDTAAVQGKIAGYSAVISLGYDKIRNIGEREQAKEELLQLRDNLQSASTRAGLEQFRINCHGGN